MLSLVVYVDIRVATSRSWVSPFCGYILSNILRNKQQAYSFPCMQLSGSSQRVEGEKISRLTSDRCRGGALQSTRTLVSLSSLSFGWEASSIIVSFETPSTRDASTKRERGRGQGREGMNSVKHGPIFGTIQDQPAKHCVSRVLFDGCGCIREYSLKMVGYDSKVLRMSSSLKV